VDDLILAENDEYTYQVKVQLSTELHMKDLDIKQDEHRTENQQKAINSQSANIIWNGKLYRNFYSNRNQLGTGKTYEE
jgi:hypothetical protein